MVDFITFPDPRLREKAEPAVVDDALIAIGHQLLAAQQSARSYGLAASHIGINAPIIVLNVGVEGDRQDLVYFNPEVLAVADTTEMGVEASVSLPGVEVQVRRPIWVEIGFDDAQGKRQICKHAGFLARCALHEIDQMNGMFFLNHLSKLKREMAIKKYHKLNRAGLASTAG